jgi:hypothetical protein
MSAGTAPELRARNRLVLRVLLSVMAVLGLAAFLVGVRW